ncbi:MAG TPA: hypothetical protein VKQ72_17025 [Aggregatilineales bacterium]|nr:hypothetical protein [Aggregatilineales bacterium]
MELKQFWAVIVRRWWLIVLPAVVALILTLPSLKQVISAPGGYSVTIRFTASQVPSADSAKTFQDQSYIPWLASEYAVNNLATWMRTQSFAQEISDELAKQNLTLDPKAIQGAIATDSARSIMSLSISWPDPDEIQAIGKAAIDVLQNRSAAYFPQFAAQKVVITPQDSVTPAPVSASITTRLSPLLRVGVGLLVGLALAFLAEYLDPTIRSRQEIEALNLPIIAEIPRWQ